MYFLSDFCGGQKMSLWFSHWSHQAKQEYKFRYLSQMEADLMSCWFCRQQSGNGKFYLSSGLMLTVGKPDQPGIIKAFATWGFQLVYLWIWSAEGDVTLCWVCAFGVVLSYLYKTDVTNPHPDNCIMLLKLLNFQLQLIMRKARSDREREFALVMPFK